MPNTALTLRVSPEETARFGVVCGRADHAGVDDLDEIMTFCRRERIQLLTLRCDVRSVAMAQLVEHAGFRLMDTLVYTALDLPRFSEASPAAAIRISMASPEDAHEIGVLSHAAFADYVSHYHADPLLPKALVADAYREWAERLCRRSGGEQPVLVARDALGITGFAALSPTTETDVDCELCAVIPRAQGQGIFRALIGASVGWARDRGIARLTYSTQIQNAVVLRALTTMGFRYVRAVHTFHKWLQPDGSQPST